MVAGRLVNARARIMFPETQALPDNFASKRERIGLPAAAVSRELLEIEPR